MAFQKGKSGNPKGRPKGAINHANREIRAFFDELFHDPQWAASARKRILAGRAPHLEAHGLAVLMPKPRAEVTASSGDIRVTWQE